MVMQNLEYKLSPIKEEPKTLSQQYDKLRKEQMDRIYDFKHQDKILFTYLLMYNFIMRK